MEETYAVELLPIDKTFLITIAKLFQVNTSLDSSSKTRGWRDEENIDTLKSMIKGKLQMSLQKGSAKNPPAKPGKAKATMLMTVPSQHLCLIWLLVCPVSNDIQ